MTGTALHGRDAEFAALGGLIGDACADHARMVSVEGAG
jgi:hypothetical protein